MELLAIIPARGGSKGIPKKNLSPLAGKPLITWAIQAAKESGSINRLVVTTDCEEIAHTASKYGAEVPFLRPKELALDDTSGIEPLLHVLNWLEINEGYKPDYIMLLQPTSPLRTSKDIDNAVSLLKEKKGESLVSISPVEQHPYWMKRIDEKGRLVNFCEDIELSGTRQELPPVYILNGAIYLAGREQLLQNKSWYDENTLAYVMPQERSLDIDTPLDLFLAEYLIKKHMGF